MSFTMMRTFMPCIGLAGLGQTMSDYATPNTRQPAILRPQVYFRISGVALLAVAILGLVLNIVQGNYSTALGFNDTFLNFTFSHDALHFVLAIAAFVLGFASVPARVTKVAAIVLGFVYVALGIAGFFMFNAPHDTMFLALTPSLDAVHLLLGAYALASGFTA